MKTPYSKLESSPVGISAGRAPSYSTHLTWDSSMCYGVDGIPVSCRCCGYGVATCRSFAFDAGRLQTDTLALAKSVLYVYLITCLSVQSVAAAAVSGLLLRQELWEDFLQYCEQQKSVFFSCHLQTRLRPPFSARVYLPVLKPEPPSSHKVLR